MSPNCCNKGSDNTVVVMIVAFVVFLLLWKPAAKPEPRLPTGTEFGAVAGGAAAGLEGVVRPALFLPGRD